MTMNIIRIALAKIFIFIVQTKPLEQRQCFTVLLFFNHSQHLHRHIFLQSNTCVISIINVLTIFTTTTHFHGIRAHHTEGSDGMLLEFNSIQAFIDAAHMHGQRRLTISSISKSTLILVSVIQRTQL